MTQHNLNEAEKRNISITLDAGDEISLTRNNRNSNVPNYFKIGNGNMSKNKPASINLIKELVMLSKPAQQLIDVIMDGMHYVEDLYGTDLNGKFIGGMTFVVEVRKKDHKYLLDKGLPELFEKDLVRRVSRGKYMINPHALQTVFHKQKEVWDKASNPKQKDEEVELVAPDKVQSSDDED
ncbi:MAG: hypothetical protein PVF17_00170 [Ignavibacteria bacterium]|jgi:hypothetical protein